MQSILKDGEGENFINLLKKYQSIKALQFWVMKVYTAEGTITFLMCKFQKIMKRLITNSTCQTTGLIFNKVSLFKTEKHCLSWELS